MKRKVELIDLLIKIETAIHDCYRELSKVDLGRNKNKFEKRKEIYRQIEEFQSLENEFFQKLKVLCVSEEEVEEIKNYLFDNFHFCRILALEEYITYQDNGLEARRLLEKIESEMIDFSDVLEFNEDEEMDISIQNDSVIEEEALITPLIDSEDVIRFIQRIDMLLSDNELEPFTKQQLHQFKYDMIFVHPKIENLLIKDYCIPTLAIFDAKKHAAFSFRMVDEKIEKAYDQLREIQILNMAEALSQKINQNDNIANQLRYLAIDIWVESISDEKLFNIINFLEEKAENSYNTVIYENRFAVYEKIYEKYKDRLQEFEREYELSEKEIEKENVKVKQIKNNTLSMTGSDTNQ